LLRELESNRFITELNKIQGVEDEDIGESTAEKGAKKSWLVSVEHKAKELFEILPGKLNHLEKNETSSKNPIFRFLNRELTVASKLLNKVRSDLQKLIEMCKGNLKSTNDLREIARDLFNDQIPRNWKTYAIISLNVTEWIMDLRNRILQLNKVSAERDFGKRGIWLGGLIFPEAYLTATRQYVAQALRVPLDELILSIELPKTITQIEENDFIISGISLEGAEWDFSRNKLIMTDGLFCQLPNVILRWNKKDTNLTGKFNVPVYLNNMRKNLLFSVMIDNDGSLSDSDWYQRGTALIGWNKTFDYQI
jgi:dynein heavy chain 1